jgi:small subunit ribosomal protein S3
MVIGRGGKTVRNITQTLKTNYGLENPQVEVKEVDVPELNPKIMAHKIAAMLQRGMHFRRVAYTALRRIMGAGAQGVEVTISGKIRGARSATAKFNDGYIKKCGEPSTRFVKEGFATVQLKPGVLGIYVRIMPPGMILPDKVDILKVEVEEPAVDTIMDTLETEEAEEPQAEEIEDTELSEIEVEEEPVEDSITEEPSEESVEDAEETKEETTEEPEKTEDKAENNEEEPKEAVEEPEKPE